MMKSYKEFLHYLSKKALKILLKFFWMFPVENNKIVLLNELSFTYGDSMKYLARYIVDNYSGEYKLVFPIKEGYEHPKEIDVVVKPMSFRYFRELLTSKVIITNAGGVSYLPKRSGQLIINTWHGGGPYKKTGLAVFESKWYKKESELNSSNIDYLLSSCEYFTKYEAKTMLVQKEKCVPSGLPRNDIFFKKNVSIKEKVYNYYSIKPDSKLILFAPTFRSDLTDYTQSTSVGVIDINYKNVILALKKRFGGEWTFALRLHPKLKELYVSDDLVVNMTKYPDMQELLFSADLIISDYSSLIWDFALTRKPCFIYAPDIDEYEKNRGFYMPSNEWPYPIAKNDKQLIDNINSFDELKYALELEEHLNKSGNFECGKACETVIELIKKC